ncbi:MAG: hypothetical protein FD126_1305 [Elusimicrobia bacterium]|nr:MAG: hypothetical protein FD126_1305 [Elusimicrobiota bacterium]
MIGGWLGLLLASAFFLAVPAAAQDVVLLDGKPIISEADLADWSGAQGCYGEGALTSRRAAFMRLTEAALADAAMRSYGGPDITDADVAKDADRIDKETQAPDILACIKSSLGPEYRRVFVRPSYTESRLRLFLMKDAKVQAGERKKVTDAAAQAKGKGGLEAAAKALGLHYSSATFSLTPSTSGFRPDLPPAEYQAEFIKKNLEPLQAGAFSPEPIETDYTFQTVRLLRHDEKGWLFETAVARKLGQEEWFKSLPRFKLEIRDSDLHDWVLSIKGNPRLSAVDIQTGASR